MSSASSNRGSQTTHTARDSRKPSSAGATPRERKNSDPGTNIGDPDVMVNKGRYIKTAEYKRIGSGDFQKYFNLNFDISYLHTFLANHIELLLTTLTSGPNLCMIAAENAAPAKNRR